MCHNLFLDVKCDLSFFCLQKNKFEKKAGAGAILEIMIIYSHLSTGMIYKFVFDIKLLIKTSSISANLGGGLPLGYGTMKMT